MISTLTLRQDGTALDVYPNGKTYPGKWRVVRNQLLFTYDNPIDGQAIANIVTSNDGVALVGVRRKPDAVYAWKATKPAVRPQ